MNINRSQICMILYLFLVYVQLNWSGKYLLFMKHRIYRVFRITYLKDQRKFENMKQSTKYFFWGNNYTTYVILVILVSYIV